MNQLFRIEKPFQVPDGTMVSPFLNAKDIFSDLPFELLDGFSIAAGEVQPHVDSKIHILPVVTQVTFVFEGQVNIRMKESGQTEPYIIRVGPGEAVLTRPGTFFQLSNPFEHPCRVLYIVSPAYAFLVEDDKVLYDDAFVLERDWSELADMNPSTLYTPEQCQRDRATALKRIKLLKSEVVSGHTPKD